MTEDQTTDFLAVIAAAYPDQFKGMNRKRAEAILALWTKQLERIDADIASIALDQHIKNSPFAPKIADIRKRICGIYYDAAEQYHIARVVGREDVLSEVRLLLQKIEKMGVIENGHATFLTAGAGNYQLGAEDGERTERCSEITS